jgi:glycosyltransferase involved in cell wall biosynthesis
MKTIGIVIPWFGKDLKGGAEQQAWQVARRLVSERHAVHVLTTCCRSFLDDWSVNHYKPGITQIEGITVRRFPVISRNREAFARINSEMLNLPRSALKPGVNPVHPDYSAVFINENINSHALIKYLRTHKEKYYAFIFIPYLYGPIIKGISVAAERAYLQPCLHDEVYAYLPEIAEAFHAVKGILFNSIGEAILGCYLYGPGIIGKSFVVGEGVEVNQDHRKIPSPGTFSIDSQRYVLCLGRRDETKNTHLLVRAYEKFRACNRESSLQLVLAGPGNNSFGESVDGLWDLGFVSDEVKESLLDHCRALFQPSRNESYSRVIMEAWLHGKPVAVHSDCLATATAVEVSRGGWLACSESQWSQLFEKIDSSDDKELHQHGRRGYFYSRENTDWNRVINNYKKALGLELPLGIKEKVHTKGKLREIHQIMPNLFYGDAISNQACAIRDYLRQCGYNSEIFVQYLDKTMRGEGTVFALQSLDQNVGLIYHHSIGSDLTDYAIKHKGPKCLIYHNITPSHFFKPFRPAFASLLEKGRKELTKLAPHFPVSAGVSEFNASELHSYGFYQPFVVPIMVMPHKWDMMPDREIMKKLSDGRTNILFVGRLAPNKRQDHLIEAFSYYLTMDSAARLILVGGSERNDPYYYYLRNISEKLGLAQHVIITGLVSEEQLLAYYRTAHLLWSMSEHEGFCVPLIEAMWCDVPVLAYKSTTVKETLDKAGIMFTHKKYPALVASLARILISDRNLREKIIKAQRKRRLDFLPRHVWPKLHSLIDALQR